MAIGAKRNGQQACQNGVVGRTAQWEGGQFSAVRANKR